MAASKKQPTKAMPNTRPKNAKGNGKYICTSLHCLAKFHRVSDLNRHMKLPKHAQDMPCSIMACSYTVAPQFKEEHEALHRQNETIEQKNYWEQMWMSGFVGVPADGTFLPLQTETAPTSSSNPLINDDQEHENHISNFAFPSSVYEHSPYQEMPQRNPATPRTTWQPNHATLQSLNGYSCNDQLQHQTSSGQNEENYTVQQGNIPFDLPTSFSDMLYDGKAWEPSDVPF